MKLPFPFIKSTHLEQQQQHWPWPSCANSTKTLSFRSAGAATTTTIEEMGLTTESPPQLGGNTVDSEDDSVIQVAINRKQCERLFFTPGETNSILEEAKSKNNNRNGFLGIKEIQSVVMEEMESTNPYVDFRKSMKEMVEANAEIKGSMEGLQELLNCYLTVNEKNNHVYIVGAFIDLLTSLSLDDQEDEQNYINNDSSLSSNSPISALSFTSNSSSCTSSTARSTTTPCSVEEGGDESTSSCSTSEKTLVVVVEEEENCSPSCSSQV